MPASLVCVSLFECTKTNPYSCREGRSRPNGSRGGNEKGNQISRRDGDVSRQRLNQTIQNSSQRQSSGLEKLHSQTDIRNSLRTKQAKLTPGPIDHSSLKRKAKETFEIQFTEVELRHTMPCNAMDESLDEDLPSVEDLLGGRKSANCDKNTISPTHSPESRGFHHSDVDVPRKRSRIRLANKDEVCEISVNSTRPDNQQPLSLLPDEHNREVSSRTPVMDPFVGDAGRPVTQLAYESMDILVQGYSAFDTEPLVPAQDHEHRVVEDDEFADLDEWLHSSCVETD